MLVCSFEPGQEEPAFLAGEKTVRLDLSDISGTSGYCSAEAGEEIRRRLAAFTQEREHYLGNGNYHYMTLFFLERLEAEETYDLVVFDHHTDMQESSLLPMLSCGSWVLYALAERKNLRKVFLVGPPKEAVDRVEEAYRERVSFMSEEEAEALFQMDLAENVYISADLDICRREDIETIWDQGNMPLTGLFSLIKRIKEAYHCLGVDYCG